MGYLPCCSVRFSWSVDYVPKMCTFFLFQTSCHETRKRKETELEMLTGTIEGWEEEVSKITLDNDCGL